MAGHKNKLKNYIPEITRTSGGQFLVRAPTDLDIQNDLGLELKLWATNEDNFEIEDFPISKSIAPSRFFAMAEMNPYFEECLDISRAIIASRLIKSWRTGLLPRDFVIRILPLYHKEFKNLALENRRVVEEARTSSHAAIFHIGIPDITTKKEKL